MQDLHQCEHRYLAFPFELRDYDYSNLKSYLIRFEFLTEVIMGFLLRWFLPWALSVLFIPECIASLLKRTTTDGGITLSFPMMK